MTVGSKTFNIANLFYFDELVDTGIEQELAECKISVTIFTGYPKWKLFSLLLNI